MVKRDFCTTLSCLARSPRLPDAYFNFLISGLVAYLTHQAVQSIESTALSLIFLIFSDAFLLSPGISGIPTFYW